MSLPSGVCYGLASGTMRALVADPAPESLRGPAFGTHSAVVSVLRVPAPVIAGVLRQGAFGRPGFGPRAPLPFGGALAMVAAPWCGGRARRMSR